MHCFTFLSMALWVSTLVIATPAAGTQTLDRGGTPKRIRSAAPVYPPGAARRQVRGPVVVELTVNPRGVVQDVAVLRGDRLLGGAAVAAARRWRFQAGRTTLRFLAALNVEPADPATAPNISPPPVLPPLRGPSDMPPLRGVPGSTRMMLTIGRTGRVMDATSAGVSRPVLVEALDTALRWHTEPFPDTGVAERLECRAQWVSSEHMRVGQHLQREECDKVAPDGTAAKKRRAAKNGAALGPADVVVEIVIDARGIVGDARLLRPNPAFGQEALDAVRRWRFGPVFFNGVAVPTIQTVVIPFRAPEPP